MRQVANIFQRLFGSVLVLFVGMDLFGWEPPPVTPEAQPLWDAIIEAGYIMPVVMVTYGICGVAFIADRFAPLASILLAPVSLNILLFHSFLNPSSIPFAGTFFVCNALMLYIHRSSYSELLSPVTRSGSGQ
jgi:hypothetical protein